MDELLDHLDDELDSGYFIGFEKYINAKSCPMDLDEFMTLEMRYYDRYRKRKYHRNRNRVPINRDNATTN